MGKRSLEMRKWATVLILIAILLLYLILRLGWQDTIEFGYDQPLLSMRVLEFLSRPTFLKAYDFVSYNPWGFPSWGVGQIFFWSPFFLLSHDPIFLSKAVVLFNLVGVFLTFYIGKKFFSAKVGIIAALIFALHPWSIIFSRMIYQPTPVATLVAISMFLSLLVLEKEKSKLLPVLIFSWAALVQIYIHTVSFVVASFGLLLFNLKKASKRSLFVGLFISFLSFLPTIYFFTKSPAETLWFLRVSQKFEELRDSSPYTPSDIVFEFLGTLAGGRLNWQFGYGYENFLKDISALTAEKIGVGVVVFIFLYNLVRIFSADKIRAKRLALIFWAAGPIWFLVLIRTPIALPRYFLLSLPAFCLLFSIFIDEISKKVKILPYIFVATISVWWIFLIVNYYNFITSFTYTRGFLSYYADVPYSFLDKSFNWIRDDAKNKGYGQYLVSNDFNNPRDSRLNSAQTYYWTHILGRKLDTSVDEKNKGFYLMYFSPKDEKYKGNYKQFGPYIVYEVKN